MTVRSKFLPGPFFTGYLNRWTARFYGHSEFPCHGFPHCKVFAPAAPRRAWIRVSESISGLLLLQPVPITGLLGRYPNNNLIGRRPILWRRTFRLQSIPAFIAYGVLSPVFRGYRDWETDRKSTRLNSSHSAKSRMPSSA